MGAPAAETRSRPRDGRRQDGRGREGERKGEGGGEGGRQAQGGDGTPLSEWVAAAVGLVVVLATLAALAWLAFDERDGRVVPVVHVESVERQGERHHVRLRLENTGAAPASALRIHARLRSGDTVLEQAEVEFDHVPARSERTAGVFFARDPRQATLEIVVESYREP